MNTPILIGIHGVKQSGKGTVARFITEWAAGLGLSSVERGFADEVKLAVARLFFPGISREQAVELADEYKEDEEAWANLSLPGQMVGDDVEGDEDIYVSYRQLLQHMGTEVGRDMWGVDFWVDRLLPLNDGPAGVGYLARPKWHESFNPSDIPDVADFCLISDLRFENEARRITDLDGFIIRVKNDTAEQDIIQQAKDSGREIHRSELLLPYTAGDLLIENNGSLEDLKIRTIKLCEILCNDWKK